MESKNTMEQIITQAKKIEENNNTNMEYTSSIDNLFNSSNSGAPEDTQIAKKLNKLNKQIKDINSLTNDLLNDLNKRHN